MLLLNPRTAKFGDMRWTEITAIAIDRTPRRRVEEWSDEGPYAVFADVPEQRVRIVITQELVQSDTDPPIPGAQDTLIFYTSPAPADSARKKVSATAVILDVRHELSLKKGAVRTITLAAVSDGASDPITITDASSGEV